MKITIKLLSDALINSGEGFGAIIDSDVVFDDIGLPYIPAKRIKGLSEGCRKRGLRNAGKRTGKSIFKSG